MGADKRIAIRCAAVAVAVACVAIAASLAVQDGKLSALVRMSAEEPMARLARDADPGFRFVHRQAHYDGVYFYAIARDPFATGEAHELIDAGAYRYGHAGYGWLAWIASAGQASAVPAALVAVGLAGIGVGAYAASRLARGFGWSAWGGLVVAISPGLMYAITADTSEPVAVAAAALALLAWRRKRWGRAGVALAAGCLIKEPLLIFPAGLAVWELIRYLRGERVPDLFKRAVAILVGPAAFGAWAIYVRNVFGTWPFSHPTDNFLAFPFTGWWDTLKRAAQLAAGPFQASQIGNASVALIVVTGAVLLLGAARAARLRSELDPIFLMDAFLIFSLNWLGVLYPKDLIRETVIPIALVPAVVAGLRRRPDEGQG